MIGLPPTWPILGAVVAAAFAAGVAGGWAANGWRLEGRVEQVRREHSDQVAAAAHRVADAQARQRAIELQRSAAQQEVSHVASLARSRADDDRRSADAAHQRLLNAARAAAARSSGAGADTATAGSCETVPSAGPVLAIVLERLDDVAGELAAALDQSRAAGLGCERYVDALTNQP